MKFLLKSAALLLCFVLCSLPVFAQPEQNHLRIGLIPEMNVFSQMERFKPLAGYLTEKLGMPVEFTILSRYGNILERFKSERMDGAFLGSFTGALAIHQLGVVPLARPVNHNGDSTYHGHIYARKDSGIKSVADMRGKKFAFVEQATTAGYIFPLAYLKEQGVTNLDSYFSEYYFAGSHDASLLAVLNGQADVGASKNTVYDWVKASEPRIDKEIVIVAESASVPSNGLCVRKDLPDALKEQIRSTLLDLHTTPRGLEVLDKLKAANFILTRAEDYQPVIDMAQKAGIDLNSYQYRNE